jgi:hypothetical protein
MFCKQHSISGTLRSIHRERKYMLLLKREREARKRKKNEKVYK